MEYTRFSEEFDKCENVRKQIICDILFAPNPPSIEDVTYNIPQPSTHSNAKTWSANNKLWNAWTVGALHKAIEIRAGKNMDSGWGSYGTFQRGLLENQVYEVIKNQSKQIAEQSKQILDQQRQLDIQHKLIDEIWNQSVKPPKKDEWDEIEATEI